MSEVAVYTPEACFALAERVASSALMPQAYRGKPTDAAIAMLYGVEMGMSPMTSLQRIVVINGKPTLDAQGMVALIRQAGHSISGEVDEHKAVVRGKRGDTGDEMVSTFSMDDAKIAGLAGSTTYKKYPKDMLWARAVSQLGRRLFADVLMAASYGPEEMDSVVASTPVRTDVRADDLARTEELAEVFDAEIIEEPPPEPPRPKVNRPDGATVRGVKYASNCRDCGNDIALGEGGVIKTDGKWVAYCDDHLTGWPDGTAPAKQSAPTTDGWDDGEEPF